MSSCHFRVRRGLVAATHLSHSLIAASQLVASLLVASLQVVPTQLETMAIFTTAMDIQVLGSMVVAKLL